MESVFTPSPLQTAVFTTALETVGNKEVVKKRRGKNAAILVRARAGTGKTTTAVEMIAKLKKAYPHLRILFTVFANRNRADMERKATKKGLGRMVPGRFGQKFESSGAGCLDIRTMNSLGLASLNEMWGTRLKTEMGKKLFRGICDQFCPPMGKEPGEMPLAIRKGVERLAEGAMAYLASTDEELATVLANRDLNIVWNFVEWPTTVIFPIVRNILRAMRSRRSSICFSHQIYVPAFEGNRFGNYDVVIVDEMQDQSPAKMRLCELALAANGVMIAIGDDAQSIFGFAGADSSSMRRFIEKWDPVILPLSITYRCPRAVVASVLNIVPDYVSHPSAMEGEIVDGDVDFMHENWRIGDVCISRTNAPLVKHCLFAWRQELPAMIVGKEFAEELEGLLKESRASLVVEFLGWLSDYASEEMERLVAAKREEAQERLSDVIETLESLCEGMSTVAQVRERMDRIFVQEPSGDCLVLSTTHKFKGGEAPRIWMFIDTYKPTGRTYEPGEDIDAEDCLYYVASTRVLGDKKVAGSGVLFKVPVKNKAAAQPVDPAKVGDIPAATPKAEKKPKKTEVIHDVAWTSTSPAPTMDQGSLFQPLFAAPKAKKTPQFQVVEVKALPPVIVIEEEDDAPGSGLVVVIEEEPLVLGIEEEFIEL